MNKIIEEIVKVIPFGVAFGILGVSEDISKGLAAIVGAVVLYFSTILFKWLKVLRQNKKAATDLKPYFTYKKVKQSRALFIQTQGQNLPPSYEEEMKDSNNFIVKKQLILWFLKNAFNEKKESNKYYLILADSGMGKTTFMINLYISFHTKYGHKQKIKLIPFGDKRIVEHLKELSAKQDEAKNTILLLDAFDEYNGLLPPETPDGLTDEERFRKQFDIIAELTQDFREVVITSRTQYFPGQEKEDYFLKIKNFSTDSYHELVKMYLSPFDENEIEQYLNKKYSKVKFWNRNKKRIAKNVVNASPKLMVRPMLLAYIDYLVDEAKVDYKTTYEIYETLVAKWIDREAKKRIPDARNREKFKNDLYNFSCKIALEIYQNPDASIIKETAMQVCNSNGFDLKDYQITGQSLLTRDVNHNWKFAHKSILEFFIAKHAQQNFSFYLKLVAFNFAGFDMTRLFCSELGLALDLAKVKGGTFQQESRKVSLSDFYISKFQVNQKLWQEVIGNNPSHFNGKNLPVEQVSWYDAVEFCNKLSEKSGLSPYYNIDKNKKDPDNKNKYDDIKWAVSINKNAKGYRLLTEAEWEFAARGGTQSKGFEYAGSKNIDEVAWYDKNSNKQTHNVGEKKANELGIYDMSGNVWEWCWDWYGDYENKSMENLQGAENGSSRVIRGGSWDYNALNCSFAYRAVNRANRRHDNIGFRIALSL